MDSLNEARVIAASLNMQPSDDRAEKSFTRHSTAPAPESISRSDSKHQQSSPSNGVSDVAGSMRVVGQYPVQPKTNYLKRSISAEIPPRPPGFTIEGFVVISKDIGYGSGGTVSKVREISSGLDFAMKKLKDLQYTSALRSLLREVTILQHCEHVNVMRLHQFHFRREILKGANGILKTHTGACIIMPWMAIDLSKLLNSVQPLSFQHVQYLTEQILLGVRHLHKHGIIHRDLKPQNIFINGDCSLRVGDFGLSRCVDDIDGSPRETASYTPESERKFGELSGHVGTRWYRSPELILLGQRYDYGIDTWAIGCILAELIGMATNTLRKPLFKGECCFPVSPESKNYINIPSVHPKDQLQKIIDVIGPIDTADLIQRGLAPTGVEYLHSARLPPGDLDRKQRLSAIFSGCDESALDLLYRLLDPSPSSRITLDDALKHPFIDNNTPSSLTQCLGCSGGVLTPNTPGRDLSKPMDRSHLILALENISAN